MFLAILFVAIIMVPFVSADATVTHNTTPFITIDPIGNHAIGEVFVIKGTTNLPPVIDSLLILIDPTTFNPSGFSSSFQATVPIQRGEKDMNFWSCTVPTTTRWVNFQPRGRGPNQDPRPDNYRVTVESSTDTNISQFQLFDILPAGSNTNSTISPAPTLFIKIDPIGNHTVGNVFFINGTTSLPDSNDSLTLFIGWADFNSAGVGVPFYRSNISIRAGENGVNAWSAEIIPSRWEMINESSSESSNPTPTFEKARPGKYVVYVGSLVSQDPAPAFFYVNQESKITPGQTFGATATFSSTPSPAPTQSSPLSTLLPIVVFVSMLVLKFILKEK
ncbi:MAG: hypothetical protein WC391_06525 [Methanoregula sp.]